MMTIYNRNSKTELVLWVNDTLLKSKVCLEDRVELRTIAHELIEAGGLRGDISDAWKREGFTSEEIPDLYV